MEEYPYQRAVYLYSTFEVKSIGTASNQTRVLTLDSFIVPAQSQTSIFSV